MFNFGDVVYRYDKRKETPGEILPKEEIKMKKEYENSNIENSINENEETMTSEKAEAAGEKRSDGGKKKKKGIIAGGAAAAVVVIVLVAMWATGVIGGISESEAKDIAYGQVPGAVNDGSASAIKEFDDGSMKYDIQIVHDNTIYDFTIKARGGQIVSQDVERIGNAYGTQGNQNAQSGTTQQGSDIGVDKAREIALGQVSGAAESNIVKTESDVDDGRHVYEIEIVLDGMEYDFEIDATNGNILSRSSESVHD